MEERIITDGCIDIPSKEDYDGDKFLDMCSGRGDYARPYDEIVLRDQ
jgi:ubiquinone/menaquinone biosynthesis C-methylase UbiE